jgi:DNA adenine methylase
MSPISYEALRELHQRARSSRPFLKWAGGKQPFLARYADRFPRLTGRYIEPFMGSASVFFFLKRIERRPFLALLGDKNLQLVRTFLQVRDNPQLVLERLDGLSAAYSAASDKAKYYGHVREQYNNALPKVDAATFIFLNRTCWNGLYRVNRAGKFNVPHGVSKGAVNFPSEADILNASASLAHAEVRAMTWQNTIAAAEPGDFLFVDPPYFSDCALADTKYSTEQFTMDSHRELARRLADLAKRGVDFLLTNSAEPEVLSMYQEYRFDIETVSVSRFISSKIDSRVPTTEVIVRPPGHGELRQQLLADELADVVSAFEDETESVVAEG